MRLTHVKKLRHADPIFFGILGIAFLLLIPFIFSLPYLDGNIEFVQSYQLYTGGFHSLLSYWHSIHPPFKLWIVSVFFYFFGIHQYVYNVVGVITMMIGVVGMYLFAKRIGGISLARIAAALFAFCPLLLSTSLFNLRDMMLTVCIIYSLYFYVRKSNLVYALFASCACLTKEPGMLLPLTVLGTEIGIDCFYLFQKKNISLYRYFLFLLPLVAYGVWVYFLSTLGSSAWDDWIFAPTARYGATYTILWNIGTLHLFNPYAYQQWLQLAVLNFAWIYWILAGIGCAIGFRKHIISYIKTFAHPVSKGVYTLFIFSLLYIVLVLSFQTYTIPRYALPVYPALLCGVAWFFIQIKSRSHMLFGITLFFFSVILILQLFTSSDPVSQHFWGTASILGQKMYNTPVTLDGNDGMTYNLQFLEVAQTRTRDILTHDTKPSPWIFADIRNDTITLKALHISQ